MLFKKKPNRFYDVDLTRRVDVEDIFTCSYSYSYGRQLKAGESDTHSALYTHTCPVPLWLLHCWQLSSSPGTIDGTVPCSTAL